MYGIFVSALSTAFSFLFRTVAVKFGLFTGLYLLVTTVVPWILSNVLPAGLNGSALTSALGNLLPSMWWWLDITQGSVGLPLCLAALAGRFLLRRIPGIG